MKENPNLEAFMSRENLEEDLPQVVYLAAPYTADDPALEIARREAAKQTADELVRQGRVIFSPLEYTQWMQERGVFPPRGWYGFDLALLRNCRELLVLALTGWQNSHGVIIEVAAAKALGIPVSTITMEEAGLSEEAKAALEGPSHGWDKPYAPTTSTKAASTQPSENAGVPSAIRRQADEAMRAMTHVLSGMAAHTAAILDPRPDPGDGEGKDRPDNMPEDLLGAVKDMADYLDGDRVPPETNRNGIPHAQEWDMGHAVNLVRDVEICLREAQEEIPAPIQLEALRELLDLTAHFGRASSQPENKPLLDQLARGELFSIPGNQPRENR